MEAKEKLGGRVHMSRLSSGSLLALGPDIISGSINNPIALMARQVSENQLKIMHTNSTFIMNWAIFSLIRKFCQSLI